MLSNVGGKFYRALAGYPDAASRADFKNYYSRLYAHGALDDPAYPYELNANEPRLGEPWGGELPYKGRPLPAYVPEPRIHPRRPKRVFCLVIDFGTSQSPKSTRPLTTYLCPSRPGHPALRNNFASSLLLRTWLPYDWTPRSEAYFVFPLALCARRVISAASRLLGTTSLRFALHGWQRSNSSLR